MAVPLLCGVSADLEGKPGVVGGLVGFRSCETYCSPSVCRTVRTSPHNTTVGATFPQGAWLLLMRKSQTHEGSIWYFKSYKGSVVGDARRRESLRGGSV